MQGTPIKYALIITILAVITVVAISKAHAQRGLRIEPQTHADAWSVDVDQHSNAFSENGYLHVKDG